MYSGFALLLLPNIISSEPLILTNNPKFFDFEDDLNSVSSIYNNPLVVTTPVASGSKAIECQNQDFVHWNLDTPSKTIDLTFKIYWTNLPTTTNQSLHFVHILGLKAGIWEDILSTNLYSDSTGYRGWNIWTSIPSGQGGFVSGDIVYTLKTNRWYTIRITANLNTGQYELYLDRIRLAQITEIKVPSDVYIDFFRLGVGTKGDGDFKTYFDDVTVSLLSPPPPPQQWSIRITSSEGGFTNPNGTINLYGYENLTVDAIQNSGYVFESWILDGTNYSTRSTVTIPAQISSTQHTLHAIFKNTNKELVPKYNWLPFQIIALVLVTSGGYILWSHKNKS